MIKTVVITGPTATGKTKMGVALAKTLNGEVISADSMQLYKYMDIGTAKPTAEETEGVPHHMLSIASPNENYSVSRYVEDATACIEEVASRGKLPIIVGGTGLYIDSLISGRDFAPRGEDTSVREKYEKLYEQLGGEALLAMLAERDPQRAEKLHPNDKKRVVRALEILETSDGTMTEHDEMTKTIPPRYEAYYIVMGYENREDLYSRIDKRVDEMMEQGLEAEVLSILEMGVGSKSTAMQAIGYKEIISAFEGNCTMTEAVETLKRSSRRYAKRQISWCGRYADACRINWSSAPDFDDGVRISTEFLKDKGLI